MIGTLTIADSNSIVILRNKVRLISKTLGMGDMEATKMASLISEASRAIRVHTFPFDVSLDIQKTNNRYLIFNFAVREKPQFLANDTFENFFERIETTRIKKGKYNVSLAKLLPTRALKLDHAQIEKVKTHFLRLSEEELLLELERKNRELIEAYKALEKSQKELLNRTQKLAKVGGWEVNIDEMRVEWTEEVSRIHELPLDRKPTVDESLRFYAPEAIPIITKAVNDGIEKGTPWDLELPFITAKGNRKWVRAIGYPERKNNKTKRLSGVFQDITERKIAESKLNESNQRFELVAEGAGSGIWDWPDTSGDKEWWSPKFYELLGYADNEIEASVSNFEKMLHPEDKQNTFEAVQKHFDECVPFEVEYRLKTKKGKYKWFLGSGQAQRDKNGRPIRMAGSIIDIENRKSAEKLLERKNVELEAKNKELEQFAYVASHDLQEPLRTVANFTQLLNENYGKQLDDTGKKSIRFITEATSRMSQLVKGLLDYSRIGSKKELTEVDCNQLMKVILEDLATRVAETGATFKIGKLPRLSGYETDLRQLFQNLITNALKFQKKDAVPRIKISAVRQGAFWKFTVQDNGIGIAEEYKEKIFVIFQRLHNRKDYEGTGIGLSHCRKIVNMHGGQIWVDSQPGNGSTFCFTLKKITE